VSSYQNRASYNSRRNTPEHYHWSIEGLAIKKIPQSQATSICLWFCQTGVIHTWSVIHHEISSSSHSSRTQTRALINADGSLSTVEMADFTTPVGLVKTEKEQNLGQSPNDVTLAATHIAASHVLPSTREMTKYHQCGWSSCSSMHCEGK
jgi:hypothetical protein